MQRAALAVLPLLFAGLAVAPEASAGCNNEGAIIQVGLDNQYQCRTKGGYHGEQCANNGAVVMIGSNDRYRCEGDAPPGGCTNRGVVAMVGSNNQYSCETQTDCRNEGAIVMVGPYNRYECSGKCTGGTVLNVGGDYCGHGPVYICHQDERMEACIEPPTRGADQILIAHPTAPSR